MDSEEVWFSHREKIYEIKRNRIKWTEEKKIWNWDRCTVSLVKPPISPEDASPKKLRVIVRSNTNQNQTSVRVNRPMTLRFMLGFDIERISEIRSEKPDPQMYSHNNSEIWTGPKERWIFQLDDDYWIWEWKEDGLLLSSSNIYKIHEEILQHLAIPILDSSEQIFELKPASVSDKMVLSHLKSQDLSARGRIIPVIYQPAVDGLKNFVREVHCVQEDFCDAISEVKVTLVFNDEQLRKNAIFNNIYKFIRSILYNRTRDVESFKIRIDRKDRSKSCFIFRNIYSIIDGKRYGLNDDSIHGDADCEVEHPISYYFVDYDHPIVFINTSNHAMAEHDANRTLWKWEYVPGVLDSPVCLGCKSREEIEAEFKPLEESQCGCREPEHH
ncbi:MAG: hypothetical protein JW999_02910 [Methanotrichaceae archaeon]|nr:hypothetical protein [Methanotrichaceae archaeon]